MSDNWTNKKVDKFVVVNQLLGEGAFGKVYRGFFSNDDTKQVACKVIPIQAISDSAKYLDLIKREISILQKLTHNKYIVKLYDVARTNNNLYIFLEYCSDGDLKEYIKSRKCLSEKEAVLFFKHIAEGFKDLYKKQIIHRDIKPANLLLHEGSIKISDFGFSRNIEDNLVPGKYTRLGSPLYMAPQILEGTSFSGKCDVWSVGIVFYEMLYGYTPWMAKDQKQLLAAIKTKPLNFPPNIPRSKEVKDLLTHMLKVPEEERFSWEQVFKHSLLNEQKSESQGSTQEPADMSKEDLELKKMNEQYLEQHLVAGYLDTNVQKVPEKMPEPQDSPSELIQQKPGESRINDEELLSDTSQMIKYKNEKEFRKSMQKMNFFILFERNIAFFFKQTLKQLFAYQAKTKNKIDSDLYNRTLFCLCKCQIINLEKVNQLVQEENSSCFSDQQLWKKYRETPEFFKTVNLIKQDKSHSYKFYQEVANKTQASLAKEIQNKPEKKEKLEKFIKNINNDMSMDSSFKEAYRSTLKEIVAVLSAQVKNSQESDKDLFILLKYILVSMNPFNEFKGAEENFSRYYETIEHTSAKELRDELLKKI
ncbi:Protein kinase-like domain [Pseudocohnilembus persalinus]|uniref:Protein kinase-like domain n=1 Tax=Pseudocohnilembus persalinus TaxID=266149 RepID=A0A0V0R8Y9_PSEPJ|nr:Protein kinase-like domain [Pseudocohnilembus persalinus]|eukprot:KRX10964.1 Protein kinase-like domain [Pseudocohnilembus persalinus]